VLRHGIFFDSTMWDGQVDALARTHRVLAIDSPGHGESADPGRPYTLADDARATLEVMDRLGVDDAALVGHSWGGMSAVRAALAAPHRVSAVALLDTPLEPSPAFGRLRYGLLTALVMAVGAPAWYGAQVASAMFSETSRRAMPWLTTDLQGRLARARRLSLARAMDAVLLRPDTVLDRVGALRQPVLVLAGDDDYVLTPTTRDVLAKLPGVGIGTIPGKHVLPLEQPAETRRRLKLFLDEAAR
jgi:pimeloyl-ACP methyl ester carboxylesterase